MDQNSSASRSIQAPVRRTAVENETDPIRIRELEKYKVCLTSSVDSQINGQVSTL